MRLLTIDGNSILNRAYYGIRLLSNSKGQYTNAILGFINIYLKTIEEVQPDHVAIAFDLPAPTFRHKAYSEYKAQRKGMPDELAMQMQPLKELLTYLGITIVEKEGYEADDIIGTLTATCTDCGCECYVATGDRDSFQLINSNVTVRLASTKETKIYTPERIMEEFGVKPRDLIEVKGLMGDASDNIPGIKGIGEKTALPLIKEHGTLENLYEALDSIKLTPSLRKKLEEGKDDAFMSRMLSTIDLDVPIERDLDAYKVGEVQDVKAATLLRELEMFSTIKRLGLSDIADSTNEEDTVAQVDATFHKSLDIAALIDSGNTIDTILSGDALLINTDSNIYTVTQKADILQILECNLPKRTYDAKAMHKFAFDNNGKLSNVVFDISLAAYLLNPTSTDYSIDRLCNEWDIRYNANSDEQWEITIMPELCDILDKEIGQVGMRHLLDNIELPLAEVLASMEVEGIEIDRAGIEKFGKALKEDITRIESEIHELAGRDFNVSSPKQLSEILFDELGLPPKKKTKSGYSTNAEVLEELRNEHPIIGLVLEYRQLTKLNSTYVDGILKVVHDDGRIHSFFRQTETRTGRISSTEPNMQNIPVRTELGRNMRKFFIAKKGYLFLDADYSQIELRVLADISNDETMIQAFNDGEDIHAITASQVFGIPLALVDSQMRNAAKAVNFGIVYGIGAYSLSQDIGVSVPEADRYIKGYLSKYHGVRDYMEDTVSKGKEQGYVTTMFGRRRYIPELKSKNKIQQALGKRIAMNTPIQGSAADIIKIAMVNVYRKLKEENLDAKLILQVHDELIVEASEADSEKASKILHEEMQNAAVLKAPLVADVNIGNSWYDAH